jgi:multidrug efflux pump subunit AcrB
MWIVRLAIRRPRAIAAMALLIAILGLVAIGRMPTDLLPPVRFPVVTVVWQYPGLSPQEMESRVIRVSEAAITTAVADVERVESQALPGLGVEKVFFHPGTHLNRAVAELSSVMQNSVAAMPPGISPPLIQQSDVSDVPILQLALSSSTLPVSKLCDLALTHVLPSLVTVKGARLSPPFGGPQRLVSVDLDPEAMTARGVTAQEVATAVSAQNLLLPAGSAKMGRRDYVVLLNNSPEAVPAFNDLPVKVVNGATVFVRDVAQVRDGYDIQRSIARVDGKPAVLVTILRSGGASTVRVVDQVRARLPRIRQTLPPGARLDVLLDQSVFARAAVHSVVYGVLIAAVLTGLLIPLFLGSWRSALIVVTSVLLSLLASLVVLGALGETLNTLTLGGLALAVGMLVDDAIVAVENTTRHLELGLPLRQAVLKSAAEIAPPALASTLSIGLLLTPIAWLAGVGRSLFLPLAMAVVFALLPSYLLSRTLVPTMLRALLGKELHLYQASERRFKAAREQYRAALEWTLANRTLAGGAFVLFVALSAFLLVPRTGQEYFPAVDTGQLRLHVRVPLGTRLEETARRFSGIETAIREIVPARETALLLDNIGLAGLQGVTASNSGTIGAADGEIVLNLAPGHRSTGDYTRLLRQALPARYPDCTFVFQPADMLAQVLNSGASAPLDIQVVGPYPNREANYALAQQVRQQVARVAGVVDAYVYQQPHGPALRLIVDRTRAAQLGLTQQTVANNLLVSLASNIQVAPSFYLDPENGMQYNVQIRTPQFRIDSMDALLATPVAAGTSAQGLPTPQLLSNLATTGRATTPAIVTHVDTQPAFDVFASVENRDLGGAARDLEPILAAANRQAPSGTRVVISGQVPAMRSTFRQLGWGLALAIVLIYLLLAVTFESWLDPIVVLVAAPGVLTGAWWALALTGTTISVPALMGTVMSLGVATANSILLVTFANRQRQEGRSALEAALAAGAARFRPVMMTALAMVLGMLPLALGLGEGGEQSAALGRAAAGGLGGATVATLFIVPLVYSVLRRKGEEGKQ